MESKKTLYKAKLHIGLKSTVTLMVLLETTPEEARTIFEDPNDHLRERIEARMHRARVDPELRGWHNYQVVSVEPVLRYWRAEYLIRSSMGREFRYPGSVLVRALTQKDAVKTVLEWVVENDYHYDDRIDPYCQVRLSESLDRREFEKKFAEEDVMELP